LIKLKLTRKAQYLTAQGIGWLLVYALTFGFFYATQKGSVTSSEYILLAVFSLGGLVLTHLFRLTILRYAWRNLPIWRLIVQVIIANLIMAVLLDLIELGTGLAIGYRLVPKLDWIDALSGILNTAVVFGIWSLIYFVVYAFHNYRREEIERLRAEQRMRESELARLKSQMNPHFVFNALNSIRALIVEDPAKAQLSITQLSHLLRGFLLSDRQKTIPLSEELRMVENYLHLEQLRYESRLRYTTNITPEAAKVAVPTMMLQTLVENAVKHGISVSITGGSIAINAIVENGHLHLSVANSGTLLSTDTADTPAGYGIENTRMRLSLLYAKEANFTLIEPESGQVVASLRLPVN
jgi:two-component system, LytTR family, sensor kinase